MMSEAVDLAIAQRRIEDLESALQQCRAIAMMDSTVDMITAGVCRVVKTTLKEDQRDD